MPIASSVAKYAGIPILTANFNFRIYSTAKRVSWERGWIRGPRSWRSLKCVFFKQFFRRSPQIDSKWNGHLALAPFTLLNIPTYRASRAQRVFWKHDILEDAEKLNSMKCWICVMQQYSARTESAFNSFCKPFLRVCE